MSIPVTRRRINSTITLARKLRPGESFGTLLYAGVFSFSPMNTARAASYYVTTAGEFIEAISSAGEK